jgi:hypothetical protein
VDPGRPSGTSPWRFLCFWLVNTIAICATEGETWKRK